MKKIIALLTLLLLITACDDGNVKVQSINFDAVSASSCGNIIYKLNSNEALILQITENTNAFDNVPTATNAPVEYQINGYNHVVYRFYNGAVTSATICGSIPPATPAVTEEWVATAGTIQITTSANKTTNTTTNGTRITGYNHYIVLKNVTFSKPVGQQVYESFVFGNYTTAPTNAMAIGFNTSNYLEQCSTSNVINNHSGSEALTLNIDPSLIESAITTPGSPRIGLISATNNQLIYRLYAGIVNTTSLCGGTTPAILEEWIANDGVAGVSGIVEVTTDSNAPGVFLHHIHLKGVTLKKGTSDFYLADDYNLGDLLSN